MRHCSFWCPLKFPDPQTVLAMYLCISMLEPTQSHYHCVMRVSLGADTVIDHLGDRAQEGVARGGLGGATTVAPGARNWEELVEFRDFWKAPKLCLRKTGTLLLFCVRTCPASLESSVP